jgi:hypothetical protein
MESLNTARTALAGAGTQTAALAFGGTTPPDIELLQKNMMVHSWTTSPASFNQQEII